MHNRQMQTEPQLAVGIQEAHRLVVTLEGSFLVEGTGRTVSGNAAVRLEGDGLALEAESGMIVSGREVTVMPADPGRSTFLIHGVTIGRRFHWERAEDQRFRGGLKLLRTGPAVTAVNMAGLELLKQYMAAEIGVGSGSLIGVSKGLHIYGHVEEIARIRTHRA